MTDKLEPEQNNEANLWDLPNVEPEQSTEDKRNAFGLQSDWRFEPPEEEIEEPVPLTAKEIDDIRQAAFDEGFNEGKEAGFNQGHEEGLAKGHEEGVTSGHEEGITKGLEEGKEKVDALSQQWQILINDLHEPVTHVENNVEQQLLSLVVQLTEAVTLQEAKTNPDIVLSAISEGIKALPLQEPNTQIYLNPQDISMVEEKFGIEYIQEKSWRLLPAPHIDIGSCQIENSTSNIDLTMKSRLKDVLDSFLQDALHQK